jgi:hypothetical protein
MLQADWQFPSIKLFLSIIWKISAICKVKHYTLKSNSKNLLLILGQNPK